MESMGVEGFGAGILGATQCKGYFWLLYAHKLILVSRHLSLFTCSPSIYHLVYQP